MKNFWEKLSKNKLFLASVLWLVLIFIFAPLHYAEAAWWNDLVSGIRNLVNIFTGGLIWWLAWPLLLFLHIVLILGLIISAVMLLQAFVLLTLITKGLLITLPFTSGGIVDIGWASTMTLANMAFVLILVFIAFGTMFRVETYGLKKLLPKLIVAILLINFSKVIAGGIIDIANVITQSFMTGYSFNDFFNTLNPFATEFNAIKDLLSGNVAGLLDILQESISLSGLITRLVSWVVIMIFGFFAAFVMYMYCLIFIMRYIMIWVLMILAPLAWACWVLPQTERFWKMWWNYFLQWAFVGAIAGFFLKLVAITIGSFNSPGLRTLADPCTDPETSGLCTGVVGTVLMLFGGIFTAINSMFIGFAVIALLVIGFLLSIKLSGGGAEAIMKIAQKTGEKATKAAAQKSASWARQTAPVTAAEGTIRKKMESIPGLNRVGMFRPGSWESYKTKRVDSSRENLSKIPDTNDGNAAIWARINQFGASDDLVMAGLHTLSERRAIPEGENDVERAEINAKLEEMVKRTRGKGLNKKLVYTSRPELAQYMDLELTDPTTGNKRKAVGEMESVRVAIQKVNNNEFGKAVSTSSLKNETVVAQAAQDSRRLSQLGKTLEKEKKEAFKQTFRDIIANRANPNSVWSQLTPAEQRQYTQAAIDMGNDSNWN